MSPIADTQIPMPTASKMEGKKQSTGTSRGGKATKLHMIVDALGNPMQFMLTGGQVHDSKAAVALLSGAHISGSNIIEDKAYGAKQIRDDITEQNAVFTIPPRGDCTGPWYCDFHTYKERHLVECFFNKLKVFRRVTTRYDKLAMFFVAFIHLASICILLK